MKSTSRITAKIKTNKTIKACFKENSERAAKIFNECLTFQMNLISLVEKYKSKFDLAQNFRKIKCTRNELA